ncbi:hypothetical protein VTI74DRAFT_7308 [Chaetomium olivicolor]
MVRGLSTNWTTNYKVNVQRAAESRTTCPGRRANRPNESTWWTIIKNSVKANEWWDATSCTNYRNTAYKGPSGSETIVCALNLFGQDTLFKFGDGSHNGFCIRDPRYNEGKG